MIAWSEISVVTWHGDERDERVVRSPRTSRVRVVSDRMEHRVGGAPRAEFDVALDADLELWLRSPGDDHYERRASGGGADLEVVGDVTAGTPHEVAVVVRPSDPTQARWHCTCGVGSRGTADPEDARGAADAHALGAPDAGRRPSDHAVVQGADGSWAQRRISVARRFRVCVRSDYSVIRVHRTGHGEDFEVVVDGQLRLWVRRFGSDAALRTDEGARGVSLIVLDAIL